VDNPTLWDFLRLNDRKSRRKYVSIICHAHRSWSFISKGRFKANGLNFHVELVHVHATLHAKSNVEFILQLFICLDTVGAPTWYHSSIAVFPKWKAHKALASSSHSYCRMATSSWPSYCPCLTWWWWSVFTYFLTCLHCSHGTCLLSVSQTYVAADQMYLQLCAPIPRDVTPWKKLCTTTRARHGDFNPPRTYDQKACMRIVAGHLSPKNKSRMVTTISMLNLPMLFAITCQRSQFGLWFSTYLYDGI